MLTEGYGIVHLKIYSHLLWYANGVNPTLAKHARLIVTIQTDLSTESQGGGICKLILKRLLLKDALTQREAEHVLH